MRCLQLKRYQEFSLKHQTKIAQAQARFRLSIVFAVLATAACANAQEKTPNYSGGLSNPNDNDRRLGTGKAGVRPGGFLLVEGEGNYIDGSPTNLNTGALLLVNLSLRK